MPPVANTDPDRDLVIRCQSAALDGGLTGPFGELYASYRDRVYNVCYRITGSPSDAADASQETFGIVYRKICDFRFDSRFSSWVYRIAVNASIDLKRRSHSRAFASLDQLRSAASDGMAASFEICDEEVEAPGAAASRHELEQDIARALGRLSIKLRTIIVLRYIEGLSYEAISESLRISIGTVKSRLSRAHAALDRELTPLLDRHGLR